MYLTADQSSALRQASADLLDLNKCDRFPWSILAPLLLTMKKTQFPSVLLRRRYQCLRSSGPERQLVSVRHFHVTPTNAADQNPPGIHTMTDPFIHPIERA